MQSVDTLLIVADINRRDVPSMDFALLLELQPVRAHECNAERGGVPAVPNIWGHGCLGVSGWAFSFERVREFYSCLGVCAFYQVWLVGSGVEVHS